MASDSNCIIVHFGAKFTLLLLGRIAGALLLNFSFWRASGGLASPEVSRFGPKAVCVSEFFSSFWRAHVDFTPLQLSNGEEASKKKKNSRSRRRRRRAVAAGGGIDDRRRRSIGERCAQQPMRGASPYTYASLERLLQEHFSFPRRLLQLHALLLTSGALLPGPEHSSAEGWWRLGYTGLRLWLVNTN